MFSVALIAEQRLDTIWANGIIFNFLPKSVFQNVRRLYRKYTTTLEMFLFVYNFFFFLLTDSNDKNLSLHTTISLIPVF